MTPSSPALTTKDNSQLNNHQSWLQGSTPKNYFCCLSTMSHEVQTPEKANFPFVQKYKRIWNSKHVYSWQLLPEWLLFWKELWLLPSVQSCLQHVLPTHPSFIANYLEPLMSNAHHNATAKLIWEVVKIIHYWLTVLVAPWIHLKESRNSLHRLLIVQTQVLQQQTITKNSYTRIPLIRERSASFQTTVTSLL